MTKKQLDNLSSMSLQQALLRAFDAGCSYGIASHIDFVQNQPDRTTVCDTLLKLIRPDTIANNSDAVKSSQVLDGSAMIPDELINGYINHLSWSDKALEREKTLVICNIRGFGNWLRTHMYGLYNQIYRKPTG